MFTDLWSEVSRSLAETSHRVRSPATQAHHAVRKPKLAPWRAVKSEILAALASLLEVKKPSWTFLFLKTWWGEETRNAPSRQSQGPRHTALISSSSHGPKFDLSQPRLHRKQRWATSPALSKLLIQRMKFQHKMVVVFHHELLECLITQQ